MALRADRSVRRSVPIGQVAFWIGGSLARVWCGFWCRSFAFSRHGLSEMLLCRRALGIWLLSKPGELLVGYRPYDVCSRGTAGWLAANFEESELNHGYMVTFK